MDADTFVALLALLILAVGASVLAAPAVASHDDPATFTVVPAEPDPDRVPSERQATYNAWVEVEESYADIEEVAYRLPYDAFEYCEEDDLGTFGIDRGGDNDGLETDETPPAADRVFDTSYFEYVVNGTFDLQAGDVVVASFSDCIYNPDEEGWYRGDFLLYDRNDVQLHSKSHYYWICECENESEARERLGPPPSETTPTPTPEATPAPNSGSAQTATPSPTATSSPDGTQTPSDADGPAVDETSTPTTTAEPRPTPTDDAAVVTAEEGGSFGQGDGPGFGVLAALAALLASGALARRR